VRRKAISSTLINGTQESRRGLGHEPAARTLTDGRPDLAQQESLLSLMAASPRLQRQCACGAPSAGGGSCAACEAKVSPGAGQKLQAKLAIGPADDPLEREADQVAERVMRMEDPRPMTVGRRPHRVRRLKAEGTGSPTTAPASVARVLATPGYPLESGLQREMSHRLGFDLSGVRIHTGPQAERSAMEVNALAYTVKQHIVFGSGQFEPNSAKGLRLLAHELTHVVQQSYSAEPFLQRSLAGCQDLINQPGAISRLSGTAIHSIIGAHFRQTVPGARSVVIPGASAGPLRSQALCGGDDPVIRPQLIGGMSGAGIPDLARQTGGGILQVAEIKPAAIECLIDGEEQLLRYIDQGNSRDPEQIGWRTSQGLSVVSPMPQTVYRPPEFTITTPGIGSLQLRTAWCTPGLLTYSVNASGGERFVPVPQAERNVSRQSIRNDALRRGATAALAIGGAAVVAVAGRALWRHFWSVVARRFAIRGAAALALSAADGPLPFGELVSLGLGAITIVQIIQDWNELWHEADQVAAAET